MSAIIARVTPVSTPKSSPVTKKSRKYTPPLKKVERSSDFLSVAERVNGRAAMIGFTSAVVDEIMTGNSISTQFHDNVGLSVAVASLAFLGTAANPKDEGFIRGFWKPETELVNGRLAMIGIISLLLTESIHPHVPLF